MSSINNLIKIDTPSTTDFLVAGDGSVAVSAEIVGQEVYLKLIWASLTMQPHFLCEEDKIAARRRWDIDVSDSETISDSVPEIVKSIEPDNEMVSGWKMSITFPYAKLELRVDRGALRVQCETSREEKAFIMAYMCKVQDNVKKDRALFQYLMARPAVATMCQRTIYNFTHVGSYAETTSTPRDCCAVCSKAKGWTRRCMCRGARYCSDNCQAVHWGWRHNYECSAKVKKIKN